MIPGDVKRCFREILNREPTNEELEIYIKNNTTKMRLKKTLIVKARKDDYERRNNQRLALKAQRQIENAKRQGKTVNIAVPPINNNEFIAMPSQKSWKQLCTDNLHKIRRFFYLEPDLDSNNHAVLSVFEESSSYEFVLRNMLVKLMGEWRVSVICPESLETYVTTIASEISEDIGIIVTTKEKYNENMLDKTFWENLEGDKILCMTPDTILFSEVTDDFLSYDYIGAPWKYTLKGADVGDGKLSLRTRKTMIEVLEKFEAPTFLSEDVFFASTMIRENIGTVAPQSEASKFSYKDTKVVATVGGSMIWRADNGKVDEREIIEKIL